MNEQCNRHEPPAWVGLWFGMFAGWLVFVFAMFLLLIASSVVLKQFDIAVVVGDRVFLVEVIAAAVVSVFLASLIGRAGSKWLRNQSALVNYVLLVVVVLLTLLSFPGIITFSIVPDERVPDSLLLNNADLTNNVAH